MSVTFVKKLDATLMCVRRIFPYRPVLMCVPQGKQEYEKQKRQYTYKRNIKARSHNYCYCGKAISILFLFIQQARLHAPYYVYIVICGLSCRTTFFEIIS